MFRKSSPDLHTTLSVPSGVVAVIAVVGATVLSYLEDGRSIRPSDLLVLYFSATALLYIPILRSLWLIPNNDSNPRALWTIIFVLTTLVAYIESLRKPQSLPHVDKRVSKEQLSSIWGRGLWTWLISFLRTGYAKILQLDNVPTVDGDLREEQTWTKLDTAWSGLRGHRHGLLRAAFLANLWSFISAVPPRLALSAFSFCQPFLIETAVTYLGNKQLAGNPTDSYYRGGLIGATVLIYLGIAISRSLYWRQTYRLVAQIRSGLISSIYRQTIHLRANDVKDSAAMTLMGTDVERIAQSLRNIHELWASLIEVGIAVWLLARQISWASVVPLMCSLAAIIVIFRVSSRFGPAQRAWVERVQERVAVTASLVGGMKAVKMLGLTGVVERLVAQLRKDELQTSEKFRKLLIWQILLSNIPDEVAPFATFAVYAGIAVSSGDETLLGAKAFASVSLIALMTHPVVVFCQVLPSCAQAAACFGRIDEYCQKGAVSSQPPPSASSEPCESESVILRHLKTTQIPLTDHTIRFENADIAWSTDSSKSVLRDLSVSIRPGFTAIIGPVASGKSTLLSAIVGETVVRKGSVVSNLPGVAFCSQTPWIMDETIRYNITGSPEFDEKWYEFCLSSCGLKDDLRRMPLGDQTRAGSEGSSLSGGQRQRVALARVVYSKLPLVVLDDVTSGLDASTVNLVLSRLFSQDGHFRQAGISVVLATHNRRLLPYMDTILVLEDGMLVHSGRFADVYPKAADLDEDEGVIPIDTLNPRDDVTVDTDKEEETESPNPYTTESNSPHNPSEKHQNDLERQKGSWSVYSYYGRSAGLFLVFRWSLSSVVAATCSNVSYIWLQKWTEANQERPNQGLGLYLGVFAAFVIAGNLAVAGELYFLFIDIIRDTAIKMHSDLLDSTLRATFDFFQRTNVGTIVNRFSQDMELIDFALPVQAAQFATAFFACVAQLIIICILGKYLAATIPFLAVTIFLIQRYYLRTSRQVRLLDIEAKAPLFKHFIETCTGVTTIRSLGWDAKFQLRLRDMLDTSQAPYYMLFCVQQWLVLVLDLVVGALAFIIVVVAMSSTSTNGAMSAGSLGVSLALMLRFNALVSQSIQAWTKMETSIGAVSRVQTYVRDTPSESVGRTALQEHGEDWPSRGAVDFRNIVASYGSSSETARKPVLSNLSLNIIPGQKIAIVGSSGSGKTSLMMALLRMMDLREGQIIVDGVDISSLAPSDIRRCINVVPQEPFFLPGSVRFNLDPHGTCSGDAEVEQAIRKVSETLWNKVQEDGGLDADLKAEEWSQGSRQLLCLVRALLTKSGILILDEATSSVDEQTESTMQQVIETAFKHQTVISILHRFTFIERFDQVVLMRAGEVVEFDSPQALLTRDSAFRQLYMAHNSPR